MQRPQQSQAYPGSAPGGWLSPQQRSISPQQQQYQQQVQMQLQQAAAAAAAGGHAYAGRAGDAVAFVRQQPVNIMDAPAEPLTESEQQQAQQQQQHPQQQHEQPEQRRQAQSPATVNEAWAALVARKQLEQSPSSRGRSTSPKQGRFGQAGAQG